MKDLMERKQQENERLTIAIANGYVLSMSKEAQAEWRASHAQPTGASPEAVAKQSSTLARLSRMFPGAVKARPN